MTPRNSVVRTLEWIQSTVTAEIIGYYNLFTTDFVLCCGQSTSSMAILIDGFPVQVLDINSLQYPLLMNESEN